MATPLTLLNQVILLVTGTFGSERFPDQAAHLANFKARSDNAGSIFIGSESGTVTLPFELNAGESTDWFEIDNLNRLWHNRSSGTDYVACWVQY
jgi:hypothetical protein